MLLAFGTVIAASTVWLIVRIINRSERWAKRALAALIGLPSLYMLSFGPACWMSDRGYISPVNIGEAYRPVTIAMVEFPNTVGATMRSYGTVGSPADSRSTVHFLILNELLRRDVTPESR